MDDKLMRLMSQFALVGLVVIVLSKASTKKVSAAPVPTNAAGPSLIYDSWVVAPGR